MDCVLCNIVSVNHCLLHDGIEAQRHQQAHQGFQNSTFTRYPCTRGQMGPRMGPDDGKDDEEKYLATTGTRAPTPTPSRS